MDYVSSPLVGAAVFFALVIIEILFYGFSAAIQELNGQEVNDRAQEGDKRAAKLRRLKECPERFINTVQMVSVFTGIVFGGIEIRIFSRIMIEKITALGWPYGRELLLFLSAAFITLLLIFLLLSVAVLTPKRIAAKNPEKWAYGLVGPMYAVMLLLMPFTYVIGKTSRLCMRLFGIDPDETTSDSTEAEIISMVNEGHEQGFIQASEAEMIHNIFEFGDKEARDIMTHRKNIVTLDGEDSLEECLDFMLEQSYSRFPVCEGGVDNIIGIVHLKDAMKFYQDAGSRFMRLVDLDGLVRPANFIPETRNIDVLFKNMQSLKIHMVIVVDEYGQTSGLIAMEDILEEIVGNIMDEYDEEETFIVEQPDHSVLAKGMAHLAELERFVDIEFRNDDYETLNGFLVAQLDRIPQDGEQPEIAYEGYGFRVLSVLNKTIDLVEIKKLPPVFPDMEESSAKELPVV